MDAAVGVRLAAARLTTLLMEPRYRRHWQVHSAVRRAELSRAAVATVLARHLFETGEAGQEREPRSLENRVGRALNGVRLSDRTLELFIAAFGMTAADADELRALRTGRSTPGQLVVADALDGERPLPPRSCRTLQLAEEHVVGADRSPRRHRTRQLLVAVEPTERWHYAFDTPHAAVSVLAGGVPVGAFRLPGSPIHVVEVHLHQPLLPGQTTLLELETVFAYPEPPRPEFRRGVSASVRHLATTLRFDAAAQPRRIWWGCWTDVTATAPVQRTPVRLVGGETSHELVPDGECVVGWTWEW
ncbi:hypothetical protein [Modestobacter sp. NPDC049651]|uniref:hypothetical protein n=1 Tax=unclassified Modestobacter TaxID=2643866 RepID=UPI0033E6E398